MARHLYIAGVDRWPDLERNTLQIDQALTYQIDTCSFRVFCEQPAEGDEVIIEDDDLGRLFAGIIAKVDLAETYPDKPERFNVWKVDCDDYTALLDRRLVVESYENMSASDIFLDIVAKYCPGFTTNGVRPGAPVVESTGAEFEYKRPSECFRWLCDYIGWHWQPDYYKDLSFFSAEELASPAPMVLRPGGQFRFGKHTIDTQGLRNRVYVRGGTMLSDPQVVQWKADGVARIWTLPWKPHEVSLEVGEVPQSVGIENVHEEADFDYLLNFQEKYIRCAAHTPTPVEGITMALTARQDIPVITMVEDYASQAAISKVQDGDGVYEHIISDDSLISIAAAEAAGMADLREHGNPRVTGSFETEYTKPPELTPAALSYTESGEDFEQGTLHQVTTDGNALVLDKHETEGTVPTALDYTESGGGFEQGELDGVVVGEDGLELEKHGLNLDLYLSGVNRTLIDNVLVTYQSSSAGAGKCIPAFILDLRGVAVETLEVACHATWQNEQPHIYVYGGDPSTKITRDSYGDIFVEDYAVEISVENLYTTFGSAASGDFDVNRLYELEGRDDVLYFFRCSSYQYSSTNRLEIHSIKVNGVELVIENTDDLTAAYTCSYVPSGSRTSLPLDLSSVGTVKTSEISWQATEPTGTSLKVETSLSTDNGQTWGAWQQATNGGSIPGIVPDMDLSNAKLKTRATLETEDTSVTPLLSSLNINLTGEKTVMIQVYYDDGYRLSPVIDLSSIAKAKSSELTYSATVPTGTSLKIETALSTDGGDTWGAWQEAASGQAIPGITAGMDLSNAKLKTRATLETEDTSVTPALNNLTIDLTGEKLEPRIWQPGQIVEINLPDRGVEGEYLIQRVTITPTWSNPSIWTFRVDYGGRLLGIADFLKALVSAQQKKRVIEPTKNVQKYIYGEETLTVGDELITATRGLPFVCGDADAVCGLVVVSNG